MTTEESLADLQRYMDSGRDRASASWLIQSWLHARIESKQQVSPDLLYAITNKRLDWPGGEHCTPRSLTSFIGKLASLHPAQSILDPTCGLGLLLQEVAVASGAPVIHGIEINTECRDVAQAVLGNNSTILLGDALQSTDGLQSNYDLIVADPPFGMKIRGTPILPQLGDRFRGEFGHALAVWACARLSDRGKAILVVTPSFLWNSHALEAQKAIRKSGCRVSALIHLPGGTFPHTGISTYLAVFERGEQGDAFIGEFDKSPEHQKSLIANYKRRKAGDQPAFGRLCSLSDFKGFPAFVAQERLKRLVRATGWPQHSAGSVILKAERLDPSHGNSEQGTNDLLLRLLGKPVALHDPSDLPPSTLRHIVRLRINPELADARYLVHWFNQSIVGQTTLASVSQSATLVSIDVDSLLRVKLCLPPLTEQRRSIQGIEHLNRVRAEATELETALGSCTEKTDVIVQRILTINQTDRYEDWIETLPFSLASILWRHRAGGRSMREQYEVLLHFFEALAAFVATIHLSAFMSDDTLWNETGQGLRDKLAEYHLSLERATFGAWKLTIEYLAARCRRLLEDDEGRETCKRVYGTPNHRLISMLCHADLLTALQRANGIRNMTSGHGGAIGQDEAQSVHDELMTLVYKIRGVFGRSWLEFELIQPIECRYQRGIYRYKSKRLMGTRSAPFEIVECDSALPMESDGLYLFDAVSQKGLLLQPFIRVMPSPNKKATACFIFSRREKASVRFVSYHFDEESSLTALFPEVDEALRRIHSRAL